jgi:hypothetical protein
MRPFLFLRYKSNLPGLNFQSKTDKEKTPMTKYLGALLVVLCASLFSGTAANAFVAPSAEAAVTVDGDGKKKHKKHKHHKHHKKHGKKHGKKNNNNS